MPKVTTAEFLVGYVHAKMEQLRSITHRLQPEGDFTTTELVHISQEILDIDVEVHGQSRTVDDERVNPKMTEYYALLSLAERLVKEKRKATAITSAQAEGPEAVASGSQILPEEIEPTRSVRKTANADLTIVTTNTPPATVPITPGSVLNPAASPFQPINHVPTRNISPEQGTEPPRVDTLDIYASDSEEPLPLELLSTIRSAKPYKPITFEPKGNRSSQREVRNGRGRDHNWADAQDEEGAWGGQPESPQNSHDRSDSQSQRSVTSNGAASFASYTSSQQSSFSRPVSGITYPPFSVRMPKATLLSRNDPNIIGRSEIFTHPPVSAYLCPICPNGKHKLYRCTTMLRAGLQMRWYRALKAGVCLNCLTRGHSSFTCKMVGACTRCFTRHNSILCPKNPNNL